jgi:hypothetical protein
MYVVDAPNAEQRRDVRYISPSPIIRAETSPAPPTLALFSTSRILPRQGEMDSLLTQW